MPKYQITTDKGTFEIETDEPKPPSWSDRMGLQNPIGRAVTDFTEGAASGLASTAKGGIEFADFMARGGMPSTQPGPTERPGAKAFFDSATTAPDNAAGKTGRFVEQAAELAIPSMAATKALKAAQYGRAAIVGADAALQGGITGLQTGGDPKAMAQAALTSGVVGGVGAALRSGPVANWLEESAQKEYGQVLAATKQGNKYLSQTSVAPGLLDRGVRAWTLKGLLAKSKNAAEATGQLIGDAWDNLPPGTKVELLPITDKLTKDATEALTIKTAAGVAKPMTDMGATALTAVDHMKRLLVEMAEVNPTTGQLEVPVDKLRKLRQSWDKVAAQAKVWQGAQLADHATGEIHAMAGDSIREKLAADFPNIAELNKEYKFWKDATQVIGDTVMRREGQAKPMSRQIVSAAGTAFGGATGGIKGAMLGKEAMDKLTQATSSAAWKTTSAVLKDKLAKAIASGNQSAAEFYVGKIVKSMGVEAAAQ